jgi:hypothetical protein
METTILLSNTYSNSTIAAPAVAEIQKNQCKQFISLILCSSSYAKSLNF